METETCDCRKLGLQKRIRVNANITSLEFYFWPARRRLARNSFSNLKEEDLSLPRFPWKKVESEKETWNYRKLGYQKRIRVSPNITSPEFYFWPAWHRLASNSFSNLKEEDLALPRFPWKKGELEKETWNNRKLGSQKRIRVSQNITWPEFYFWPARHRLARNSFSNLKKEDLALPLMPWFPWKKVESEKETWNYRKLGSQKRIRVSPSIPVDRNFIFDLSDQLFSKQLCIRVRFCWILLCFELLLE